MGLIKEMRFLKTYLAARGTLFSGFPIEESRFYPQKSMARDSGEPRGTPKPATRQVRWLGGLEPEAPMFYSSRLASCSCCSMHLTPETSNSDRKEEEEEAATWLSRCLVFVKVYSF